jgi:hypothetical protein
MKKSTKTLLWVGGAIGIVAIGGYAYAQAHKPATTSVPAGTLPAGSITPTASFATGQKYTFAAQIPAGITSSTSLQAALASAGWSNVTVPYYGGTGSAPAGFPQLGPAGYIATGTWNGTNGAAVPTGVVAAATP